jgi:DNA-binding XRE family transcriptional regulator
MPAGDEKEASRILTGWPVPEQGYDTLSCIQTTTHHRASTCQEKNYPELVDRKTKALATEIGKRIKERRSELRMSQRAMRDATGLTQGFICRIERGEVEICLGSIQAICDTLGVSIAELFRGL